MQIIQTDIKERFELTGDVWCVGKNFSCFANLHVEQFRHIFSLPAHFERVFSKTAATADIAGQPDVGQEIHVQPSRAVSFAGFAATTSHVETKSPRLPAAFLRLWQHREKLANIVPNLDVGGGIAARSATDRRLVDDNHLVELVGTCD